jgi:hypothetical protein
VKPKQPPEGGRTGRRARRTTASYNPRAASVEGFRPLSDLLEGEPARLDWLVEPILTTDALGVLAGPPKRSLKTWGVLDLTVAAASGTPWFGAFAVRRPGPVLLVVPEGGEASLRRRVEAILSSLGDASPSDLDIALFSTRSVDLRDRRDLEGLEAACREVEPVLIACDSLYLALPGVDTRKLTEAGNVLARLSDLAGEAGAAVVLSHHTNRRTDARGTDRISGAGPAEWASALLVGEPRSHHVVGGRTVASVRWDLTARDVPSLAFDLVTEIGPEGDDPTGPLSYSVTVRMVDPDAADVEASLDFAERRVLDALRGYGSLGAGLRDIAEALASDGRGRPLRHETITGLLGNLADRGLADEAEGRWWADGRAV